MIVQLRFPGEVVKDSDVHYKLFPAEVPLKFKVNQVHFVH